MRHAARGCLCVVFALVACLTGRAAEGADPDQFELQCIARSAERTLRNAKTERGPWVKELDAAFPGKVPDAKTEEQYGAWFDLLAGKNEEWRRDSCANPQVAALFDKVWQRLELGPVPNLTRAEFMTYAKKVLMREQRHQAENPPLAVDDEADKVFRVLDKNSDGELMTGELTAGVKDGKARIDADGNGRISKGEYRDYFKKKVVARAESFAAKSGGERQVRPDGKADDTPGTDGLPGWFTTLDLDKDKQISLFEWRQSERPTEEFSEMDLDRDGLLTRDEYTRYRKKKEIELDQKRREEGK